MSFVRTLLGDIPPDQLGPCYAHEHIIIDHCFATRAHPDFLLDDVEKAASELSQVHHHGGRAMVDTMPGGCGRNMHKLAEVSRRSGIHIVCPTGMHLAKYYPPESPILRAELNELAQLFVREIETGMDGTNHRAGVVKVAGGRDRLTDAQITAFTAAAIASRTTGCPIITHTEQGTAAMQQIEVLARSGADLSHVILSHTDRRPDIDSHCEILRTGACVEFDGGMRSGQTGPANPVVQLIAALLPQFPNQIMLGMDAAKRKYWNSYGGGPGLASLLTTFTQWLRDAGITQRQIDALFIDNPARAFSFRTSNPP